MPAAACLLPAQPPACPAVPTCCREAEASLRGEAGRGALAATLRELVAQRCQMVCQLGAIFQLGPTQGGLGALRGLLLSSLVYRQAQTLACPLKPR